jgi:sulfatase maturation enzyme AslB (radical SAM superfamily)
MSIKTPDFIIERLKDNPEAKLWKRYESSIERAEVEEVPPFPRQLMVEVANICNHKCSFCAYTKMTRPSQYINTDLFQSIVTQAYDLGAREIGLHGGSEPLTCKKLEEHIAFCRDLGYEYIYFSTNAALADEARWQRLLDAGPHSIKVSVNGGDRETYNKIHGRDDFEKIARNIEFISEYRKKVPQKVYLAISFVEVPENADSLAALKERFGGIVDEIFHVTAANQSGQMLNLPVSPYLPETCQIPFNQVNITREGYLRACCNDYQNMLAVEDLSKMTLAEAWASQRYRELRRRHVDGKLQGTLCQNCIKGTNDPVRPLNPALGDWGQIQ